jgi:16S rRNA processing protein RimM
MTAARPRPPARPADATVPVRPSAPGGPPPGAEADERLVVALVRGLHGIRGAVRVEVLTDRPEARFRPGGLLYPEGGAEPMTVIEARPATPGWVLRFAELADRDAAESLRGTYLEAVLPRSAVLAPDEHWWHEVIGGTVRDPAGAILGRVVDLYRAGATEVLMIDGGPDGPFEVPVARPFVTALDPAGAGIVVDLATLDLRGDARRPTPPETEP